MLAFRADATFELVAIRQLDETLQRRLANHTYEQLTQLSGSASTIRSAHKLKTTAKRRKDRKFSGALYPLPIANQVCTQVMAKMTRNSPRTDGCVYISKSDWISLLQTASSSAQTNKNLPLVSFHGKQRRLKTNSRRTTTLRSVQTQKHHLGYEYRRILANFTGTGGNVGTEGQRMSVLDSVEKGDSANAPQLVAWLRTHGNKTNRKPLLLQFGKSYFLQHPIEPEKRKQSNIGALVVSPGTNRRLWSFGLQ